MARDEHGRVNPDPAAQPSDDVRDVGFRTHGKSKDHRPDLPQVVIGMAVTRTGIPVRVWSWPGNTSDSALIRQVKDEMRDWTLGRVVWVADRGFSSAENRRYLRRAGGHYIIGEKLRCGSAEASAALSRQGRYAVIADNLQVKEVHLDDADDRFVICHNPDSAERDSLVRQRLVAQLEETIAGSDELSKTKRAELRGVISTKPGLNRILRVTAGGLLHVDQAAIKAEERLDGKYLLRSSDPKLSTEDIALGYKQLLEVERGWRDMKSVLDRRPVHHRLEDRIRAHVLLCWLALLLVRVAETTTGRTWPTIRAELQRLHAITYTGAAGVAPPKPPNPPRPDATCWPPSPWTRPAGSSNSPPPRPRQQPDQHQHPRLVTRPHGARVQVSPAQSPLSCTSPPPHLWNPGMRSGGFTSATPPLGTPRRRENCGGGCPPTPVHPLVVEAEHQPGVGARPEGSRTVAIEHAGQNFGSLPRPPGSPPPFPPRVVEGALVPVMADPSGSRTRSTSSGWNGSPRSMWPRRPGRCVPGCRTSRRPVSGSPWCGTCRPPPTRSASWRRTWSSSASSGSCWSRRRTIGGRSSTCCRPRG